MRPPNTRMVNVRWPHRVLLPGESRWVCAAASVTTWVVDILDWYSTEAWLLELCLVRTVLGVSQCGCRRNVSVRRPNVVPFLFVLISDAMFLSRPIVCRKQRKNTRLFVTSFTRWADKNVLFFNACVAWAAADCHSWQINEWRKQLRACRCTRDGRFEHLI